MSLAFFDILYYDLFMKRDEQTLNKEVAFIQKLLPFQNGGIIDFCCGVGDLLATFQKRGWETQGVEWVPEYVQLAKEQFKVSVKCGDALKIEIGIQADVCLNWFSSFGYFTKENGMRLLQNMVKHL
jgi:SAM-dependent methyltransferase